jgi:hypothetical protein
MNREDGYWLLFGIVIAFALQVFYDGIGEYPNLTQKFYGGFIIDLILIVGLYLLYGLMVKKHSNQKKEGN